MGRFRLMAVALIAALAAACASTGPTQGRRAGVSLEADLLAADRAFNDDAQNRGVGLAFADVVDPVDGMLVRPGVVFRGQAQVRSSFLDVPAGARLVWSPDQAFVSRGGDLGFTTGRFVSQLQGREVDQGRYVSAWRKDGGGRWRLLIDISAADPAGQRFTSLAPAPFTPSPSFAPSPGFTPSPEPDLLGAPFPGQAPVVKPAPRPQPATPAKKAPSRFPF